MLTFSILSWRTLRTQWWLCIVKGFSQERGAGREGCRRRATGRCCLTRHLASLAATLLVLCSNAHPICIGFRTVQIDTAPCTWTYPYFTRFSPVATDYRGNPLLRERTSHASYILWNWWIVISKTNRLDIGVIIWRIKLKNNRWLYYSESVEKGSNIVTVRTVSVFSQANL